MVTQGVAKTFMFSDLVTYLNERHVLTSRSSIYNRLVVMDNARDTAALHGLESNSH